MKGLSPMEGWLFLLRNLHNFADTPEGMDKHFEPVVQAARMKDMPSKEQLQYFRAMISEETKQDYYLGGYDAGIEEGMEKGIEKGIEKGLQKGREEGRAEERRANVRAFLAAGVPVEVIAEALGVSVEDIEKMS